MLRNPAPSPRWKISYIVSVPFFVQGLFQRGDATAAQLATAKAELLGTQANLAIADFELRCCAVKAPFAGRIEQLAVKEHELVEARQPMLKIFNSDRLLAHVLMPALYFTKLKIGDTLVVKLGETAELLHCQIKYLGASIDPASQTFEVVAEFDNRQRRLPPGSRGTVAVTSLPPSKSNR